MSEVAYLRRTPRRLIARHVLAYIKSTLMPIAAMFGGGDGDDEGDEDTAEPPEGFTKPGVQPREPDGSAKKQPAPTRRPKNGKRIHLPAYFERTPAKRYMVASLEGNIDRLRFIHGTMNAEPKSEPGWKPVGEIPLAPVPDAIAARRR